MKKNTIGKAKNKATDGALGARTQALTVTPVTKWGRKNAKELGITFRDKRLSKWEKSKVWARLARADQRRTAAIEKVRRSAFKEFDPTPRLVKR